MMNFERQLAAQNVGKAEAKLLDVLRYWGYRKVLVEYDDSQYEFKYGESCGSRISVTHVWWDDGEEVREPIDFGSGLRDVILCYFAREYECPLGFINPGKRT
jgi:hypothetical protein